MIRGRSVAQLHNVLHYQCSLAMPTRDTQDVYYLGAMRSNELSICSKLLSVAYYDACMHAAPAGCQHVDTLY